MAINFKDSEPDLDGDGIVAEINMTPLIDIMLVLLILFMVTSSMSLEQGLGLELPRAQETAPAPSGHAVIVSLGHSGQILVQGESTSMEQLEAKIALALEESGGGVVILQGDRRSSLGKAVEIMEVAKAAGATSFMIAAEGIPPPSP